MQDRIACNSRFSTYRAFASKSHEGQAVQDGIVSHIGVRNTSLFAIGVRAQFYTDAYPGPKVGR